MLHEVQPLSGRFAAESPPERRCTFAELRAFVAHTLRRSDWIITRGRVYPDGSESILLIRGKDSVIIGSTLERMPALMDRVREAIDWFDDPPVMVPVEVNS